LINLQVLWLAHNSITDITSLRELPNIGGPSKKLTRNEYTHLNLSQNQISDISPLIENPGITKGDCIDISDNPLTTESLETYIPELESRGVDITWGVVPEPPPTATPSSTLLVTLSNYFMYLGFLVIILGLLFTLYQTVKKKREKPS